MDADITIIGAGVIGLAIASELSGHNRNVYILEKNTSHGMGISSRNSEVIHAGIYAPPGSLRARLCVEGREMLYETCLKNKIPHRKTGKLIIATSEAETGQIEDLMENALKNGVSSVSFIERSKIGEMEPNIRAVAALSSPDTGIMSAHALMDYYLSTAKTKGAELVCGTKVVEIERIAGGYRVGTVNLQGESFDLLTEMIVNAAGLESDVIAGLAGRTYAHHYCKGDYFSINNVRSGIVRRLIYPVPEKNHVGLGVHLTMDLQGRLKLGPDATYIDRVEDYRVDAAKADRFYDSAVKFLPFLRREDISPDMSGIRPKLQGVGEGFRDFVISEDLPGFVNLVGIESPGLTAAPAIARQVREMLNVNH
ncbi:MAG TPA: NAD(P)/FAD-dependent oxidoreductase [Thermodesulfovibrionales bacterium]|nr:NAD(P)/FAD-dependent oxidoreductase [Thermodesulfovibrionales bacterium]